MYIDYLIALGSNLGDRVGTIEKAYSLLSQVGDIIARSKFYETEPMGAADQLFVNAACLLRSGLEPQALMQQLLATEASMGRVRRSRWENRVIDLDIIMARDDEGGEIIMVAEDLVLPHPEALKRDFVLCPAADVCPSWVLPGQPHAFSALRGQIANPLKTL